MKPSEEEGESGPVSDFGRERLESPWHILGKGNSGIYEGDDKRAGEGQREGERETET